MTDRTYKKRILVLMSGGVDSSVAAALLCEQGYEVAGVYLKLWDSTPTPPNLPSGRGGNDSISPPFQGGVRGGFGDPCWAGEMRDAAQVAAKLGIPFQVWDVTADYKTRVLENFYSEYAAGRTPNPDVLCNSEIKFGVGLERALAEGYEFVASGHYARISHNDVVLHAAADENKDQSYFLWRLTREQLRHVMFPIGEYTKPQVRELAKKFGLHTAGKKDSQGVCFLGKIDLKDFLSQAVTDAPGSIVDVHEKLLGLHDGLAHFTIGQRHGTKLGGTGPYFVIEKDVASNTLIVANEQDEQNYRTVECRIKNVELRMDEELKCMARVRYRAPLVSVTVQGDRVTFDEPQRAVAPGQSIVFYEGDRVVGGGVIDKVTLLNKLPRFISPELLVKNAL